MARQKALCIPSLVTTFIALVLLLLVTISLPLTFHDSTPLSIVDASNLGGLRDVTGNGANADRNITAIRFGLWGICSKGTNESSYAYCSDNDHEYNITLALSGNDAQAAYQQRSINTSWTRGLVVAVVAFVFTIIGLILSLPPHLIVQLIAALWLLLTLVITLVGFIIQSESDRRGYQILHTSSCRLTLLHLLFCSRFLRLHTLSYPRPDPRRLSHARSRFLHDFNLAATAAVLSLDRRLRLA